MKQRKHFMDLSKKDCLTASKACLANAESKYKDAMILAERESYGNATSQLMLSMEEMMKATILSLDGNGFQFRQKVKGIKNIFENHKLRYFLAFALSVVSVFGQDLKKLLIWAIANPKEIPKLKMSDRNLQQRLMVWMITKMEFIASEIKWFSNADLYRQDGFYVDYEDGIKSPLKITSIQFLEFKARIDNFKTFIEEFISSFDIDSNPPELRVEIANVQKMFVKEFYERIGDLVVQLNKRDSNGFETMLASISKATTDLRADFNNGKLLE